MKNLEIYCVTDKPSKYLNKTGYILGAVGKNKFPDGDNWVIAKVIEEIIGAELHR